MGVDPKRAEPRRDADKLGGGIVTELVTWVGGANGSCLQCIIMGIRCPNRRLDPEDDSPWAEPVGAHTSQR